MQLDPSITTEITIRKIQNYEADFVKAEGKLSEVSAADIVNESALSALLENQTQAEDVFSYSTVFEPVFEPVPEAVSEAMNEFSPIALKSREHQLALWLETDRQGNVLEEQFQYAVFLCLSNRSAPELTPKIERTVDSILGTQCEPPAPDLLIRQTLEQLVDQREITGDQARALLEGWRLILDQSQPNGIFPATNMHKDDAIQRGLQVLDSIRAIKPLTK